MYYSSIIKGSIQSTNLAAFTCVNTPSTDVIVDVLIIPTQLPGGGLNRLEISGDWTNIQYVGEPIDSTGLTFTAIYNDGNTSLYNYGSTIDDTFEAGRMQFTYITNNAFPN